MAKFRNDVEANAGGQFLKLKDKESVYVIFMGDPYEYYCVWNNGASSPVPEGTSKAKFRFRINAVVKEADGSYVPKIFEQGPTIYNTLKDFNHEYDGLDTVIIKITRKGSSMNDTEYQLVPLRQEIPPATRAKLGKLTLLALEHEGKAPQKSNGVADNYFDGEPGPHASDQYGDELPF